MIEEKILFVDDEEHQRDAIKMMLTTIGYTVKVAKNAADALKILEKEEFSMILTDLTMPKIDGAQLCKTIKKKNPKQFVVALSGYIASQHLSEDLEKAGFDGWLTKPISTERLEDVIKGAFDKIRRAYPKNDKQQLKLYQ
jgi:CheY-like chemotaxis protein